MEELLEGLGSRRGVSLRSCEHYTVSDGVELGTGGIFDTVGNSHVHKLGCGFSFLSFLSFLG